MREGKHSLGRIPFFVAVQKIVPDPGRMAFDPGF
jgi:hypothetical protein